MERGDRAVLTNAEEPLGVGTVEAFREGYRAESDEEGTSYDDDDDGSQSDHPEPVTIGEIDPQSNSAPPERMLLVGETD